MVTKMGYASDDIEIWRPVYGYEDYYLVSNTGRVFSIRNNRLLKIIIGQSGYCFVHLSVNGHDKRLPVHRLVAIAFIQNCDCKPTVNHINEIKTDNHVENLEWATMHEQNTHGTRIKRAIAHTDFAAREKKYDRFSDKFSASRKMNGFKRMKRIYQCNDNWDIIAEFDSAVTASDITGISRSCICSCLKTKRHTAGGYKWRYAE